jgi:hypothetical protein
VSASAGPGDAADLARAVASVLEPVFDRLDRVVPVIRDSCPPGGAGWSESHLGEAQRLMLDLMAPDAAQVGFGFVAAAGVVDGLDRYMLWWQQHEGRTSRLRLNFDRSSIDVYDYVEMEWFQYQAAGPRRVTFGPYVDYSGSELYIVTATVPVEVEGRFVGVVGADLLFEELERRLVDVLRRADTEAVVVNAERRVIAANSARWVLGSRLRDLPEAGAAIDGGTVVEVAEVPLGNQWHLALTDLELPTKKIRRTP